MECLCPSFLRCQRLCPFTLFSWGPHFLSRRKPARQLAEPVQTQPAGQSALRTLPPRSGGEVHGRGGSAFVGQCTVPFHTFHHCSPNSSQLSAVTLLAPISCTYTQTHRPSLLRGNVQDTSSWLRFSNSGLRIPLCS